MDGVQSAPFIVAEKLSKFTKDKNRECGQFEKSSFSDEQNPDGFEDKQYHY